LTTLFFYDLETSGFDPRTARIMQFAGQRTDLNLNPLEEPHNYLIKLTNDVLPDPDAILVTGITPQKTIAEGISEAEFLKIFHMDIARPDTVFVGFNTIRFDDEFMRFLHYRNFYDAYEWQWQDGRSRWDLLDAVRMTRALRPEGIKWPYDSEGKPSNRLELLTSINKLSHESAHDALSDVQASIALARLLKNKQPKLFDYLFEMRNKNKVAKLVLSSEPFLYTSGKYPSEFEKTTAVAVLTEHPNRQGVLVFDLRYDPAAFFKLSPDTLAEAWRKRKDEPGPRLPVKTLKFNRCPAVAPLGVLDKDSEERLKLDRKLIAKNHKKLFADKEFINRVLEALKLLDERQQARLIEDEIDVDRQLYSGFFDDEDRTKMSLVRAAEPDELTSLGLSFKDDRLRNLLPLYKARNYPKVMSDEDRAAWERYRERKLMGGKADSRAARYFKRLSELADRPDLTDQNRYLLEELQLYGQSILPVDEVY
jgi:exodeoxyribonuclease-1